MDVWVSVYETWDDFRVEGVYASLAAAKKAVFPDVEPKDDGEGGCYHAWKQGNQPFRSSIERRTVKE